MHLRMNIGESQFDWNHARAFLAVCEEGNLSSAARRLGQTQPTVGRQVTALEHALGVTLFERIGHTLRLTEAGGQLKTHVAQMAEAANRMSLVASGQSQEIEGRVTISVSDLFATQLVIPIIAELRAAEPGLRLDVVATNDVSDLLHREADIAIRHLRPTEPDLIARLVHDAKAAFYASSSYLQKRGRPTTLEMMADHDFVSFGDVDEMLGHLTNIGVPMTADHFKVGSANGLVAWDMVKQGLGISVMSIDVAEATPGVERLLPEMEPVTFPVWVVTHRELNTARRIRYVFDHIANALPRIMA